MTKWNTLKSYHTSVKIQTQLTEIGSALCRPEVVVG